MRLDFQQRGAGLGATRACVMVCFLLVLFFFLSRTGDTQTWEGGGGSSGSNGAGAMPNFSVDDSAPATTHPYGQYKLNGNTTVVSITGVFQIATACSSAVISVYDCGTSAGACTSPSATIGTVTFGSGTLNTAITGTVSTPNVLSGHYVSAL